MSSQFISKLNKNRKTNRSRTKQNNNNKTKQQQQQQTRKKSNVTLNVVLNGEPASRPSSVEKEKKETKTRMSI
jgi:hypothetical protein